MHSEMRLYSTGGKRLYLNAAERHRFKTCALNKEPAVAYLCTLLLVTGCRISEALALTRDAFQSPAHTVSIITLKRRKQGVVRELPVPKEMFVLMRRIAPDGRDGRLLHWHRGTAWRKVKSVLAESGIHGAQAMPKGLRHGFGVNAIQHGIPLNLIAKWMGHADIKTTAIYANATGPEERRLAARMWT